MKTLILDDVLNLVNIDVLNLKFEIIKNKIINGDIQTNNLTKERTKFETLIDVFVGTLAEEIIFEDIKNIKSNFYFISYDEIRVDSHKNNDLFDIILYDDKNLIKEILIILNTKLNIKNKQDLQVKQLNLIKNLKKDFNFIILEIKSSVIENEKNIPSKPFIQYAYPKKIENFSIDVEKKLKSNNEKDKINLHQFLNIIIKDYKIGNGKNDMSLEDFHKITFEEKLNKYLILNTNIKDVISNIFYKTFKIEGIHDKNLDIDYLTFKDIEKLLPTIFYYDFYTTKEKLLLEDSKVGILSKKFENTLYHLNKISNLNMNLIDIINDYNLNNDLDKNILIDIDIL